MTVEGEKALAWMLARQGKYGYTNRDPDRDHPEQTGLTDCSGVIRAAYLATSGINPGKLSFNQADNGQLVQRGYSWTARDPQMWEPGDVIAMDLAGGWDRIEHVEMYAGLIDGVPSMIGHGGTPYYGPNVRPLSDPWFTRNIVAWKVVRFGTEQPPTPATPLLQQDTEEEEMRNIGIYWEEAPNTRKYAIFNYGSGAWHEFSNGRGNGPLGGDYVNPLAKAFGTESWPKVTTSHAAEIKEACAKVREARR